MFWSCPSVAFVEGVKSGFGSFCASTMPGGRLWPQTVPVAL